MKLTIYSPSNIDILMWCYLRPPDMPHPHIDAPAVTETIQCFLAEKVIEPTGTPNCYRTTERGVAWVSSILNTEIPRQLFIDGHGEIIQMAVIPTR